MIKIKPNNLCLNIVNLIDVYNQLSYNIGGCIIRLGMLPSAASRGEAFLRSGDLIIFETEGFYVGS